MTPRGFELERPRPSNESWSSPRNSGGGPRSRRQTAALVCLAAGIRAPLAAVRALLPFEASCNHTRERWQ